MTNTTSNVLEQAAVITTVAPSVTEAVVVKANYYRAATERYAARAVEKAPDLLFALVIMLVAWIAAKAVRAAIRRLIRAVDQSAHDAIELLALTASVVLLTIGFVCALGNLGVNVGPLIASLGLTGFAISFASKDALTNVLCGVLIIIYRPFKRGDRISVAGVEGVVKALDLRYTTLVAEDKTYLVPNTTVFNSTITLMSRQ